MTKKGGKRPGAGRPALGEKKRRTISICLPPACVAWLDEQARIHARSRGRIIEKMIRTAKNSGPDRQQ